jgi:hypothetical protein
MILSNEIQHHIFICYSISISFAMVCIFKSPKSYVPKSSLLAWGGGTPRKQSLVGIS